MSTIYFISARTGCSCCSCQNHYRGPYRTREEAKRRISYYYSKDSKYWPLASQYARRGNYSVWETTVESISGGRFIIDGSTVVNELTFIEVNEDGTVENNESEHFPNLTL